MPIVSVRIHMNTPSYKWRALITVAMGTMMATMDASITTIALPVLTKVFETDLAVIMWVTVAYILVSSSLMLIVGKISDLIGRKRIYAAGMAIFTVGLGACSAAQSIEHLILFRSLQAVGAAMSISCGTAIVTEAFPVTETGKGLGLLSMSVSIGFILGPIVGGFLLNWLDWRSLFYIRVPVGTAVFLMAVILLKRDSLHFGKVKLDLVGALASSGGLFCLIFGISQIKEYGPTAPRVLLLLGAGLLVLGLFIWVEHRAADPIVDLSLFKNRVFLFAAASLFLFFVAAPPYVLVMPFYLMEGVGFTAMETGLLLAVVSMVTIFSSPISGALSDRIGKVWLSTFGAAATTAAFFLMLGLDLHTKVTAIIPVLILLGIGVGSFQPPNNSTIMGAVARERLGSASALIATQRQVGLSLGMALAGAIFSERRMIYMSRLSQEGTAEADAFRQSIPPAFHDVLLMSVILGAVATILSLLSIRRNKSTGTPPSGQTCIHRNCITRPVPDPQTDLPCGTVPDPGHLDVWPEDGPSQPLSNP
ncbi:MAG: family efflux transporter permease subunit [Thermodesulfobacteriota bacterium]|nr:family efflux transporter permease subunit [Thermodesulfobacteriota bacterium]